MIFKVDTIHLQITMVLNYLFFNSLVLRNNNLDKCPCPWLSVYDSKLIPDDCFTNYNKALINVAIAQEQSSCCRFTWSSGSCGKINININFIQTL